ncbi:MAG: hypothetical protein ACYC6Y_19000 [Thermoguttaceae bacterium]
MAINEMGTIIYTFADGKVTPYWDLPGGGDCSYAEAVELGDEMLVSYYSSPSWWSSWSETPLDRRQPPRSETSGTGTRWSTCISTTNETPEN